MPLYVFVSLTNSASLYQEKLKEFRVPDVRLRPSAARV
jgi:hypothetical protein